MNQNAVNKGINYMNFAMLYYYGFSANTIQEVLKQCIIVAKNEFECDSFNLMAIMDNDE